MNILDWVDFGKVSAEKDDLLGKYFYDNGVLKAAVDSKSTSLILGRKGAGKTAVFKHFCESSEKFILKEDLLVPLSFDDYNWSVHMLLVDEGRTESMAYKQSWRFVILTECVRKLKDNFSYKEIKAPKSITKAAKLLEKLFDSPIPSIGNIVGDKLLSLSKVKIPKGGLNFEDGDFESVSFGGGEVAFQDIKNDSSLQRQLSENVGSLIQVLEKSIKACLDEIPRIFVCFDKVDEGWDDVSFEESKLVIAGLVAAGDSIASGYHGKIRPLVFLREDIFSVLKLNDSNKLREDCGTLLSWGRRSLSNMLLHRVNYFAQRHHLERITDINSLFDKKEVRQRVSPFNYILKRTMMRPRDLIAFCNRIVQAMRDEAEDPFGEQSVEFEVLCADAIYKAEPGYSEWLKNEVLDEWRVQRPVINDLFNALRNNSSTHLTKDDLKRELGRLGLENDQVTVDSYLRFLFENSIIGFKLGQSTEWRFKCFYPSQGLVDSSEYRVHEGLVRSLNLTESRGKSG